MPCLRFSTRFSLAAFAAATALHLAAPFLAAAEPKKSPAPKAPPPPPHARTQGDRGIWFTLGQFSEYGDKYSGGLGTYTANHNPLAVYAAAVDRTFFVYGGSPAGERALLCLVGSYDHRSGLVTRPVIVHDKRPVDDPHDNPSLNLDPDGYLWVFVSGRARSRPGFIYRSIKPYDHSAFERVGEREITYPQPWHVAGRGFLHLFTKYTKGRELYFATSPDGRNWSPDTKLAGLGGHYQTSGARDGKVASFFNYHPGGNVDKRTNLYYAQTVDFGATWTTAAGTPLTLPLADIRNPALVRDYAAEGRLVYTCDLNFDAAGQPILLYVVSRDYRPGPAGGDREWTVAHWKDGRWLFHTVTTSDHNYDMGSLHVLGREWRIVAPTDTGPQKWGTGGDMVLWSSTDEGKTWQRTRAVTRNSEFNHAYARRPRHARDPFFTFWADGNPDKLSPSRLYFTDSTGENVFRLPYTFPAGAATAAPERVSP
jgi:hypothetical protein